MKSTVYTELCISVSGLHYLYLLNCKLKKRNVYQRTAFRNHRNQYSLWFPFEILKWVTMPILQGSSELLSLLLWQVSSLPLVPPGKPKMGIIIAYTVTRFIMKVNE